MFGLAVCYAAAMLSGCGSSEPDVTPAAPPPAVATHTAAAGPAVDAELPFEGIALDSPVARIKDRNGLEFLQFRYTDGEDKVYECVLPVALAKSKHKPSEWTSLFDVYKKPKVLAQKKHDGTAGEQLDDLPLISPKPMEAPQAEQEKPRPTINVPTMPVSPGVPSTSPGVPSPPQGPTMPNRSLPGRP